MIHLGTAIKSTEYPYHRCVVLSDPLANGGQVVLVRVTTAEMARHIIFAFFAFSSETNLA